MRNPWVHLLLPQLDSSSCRKEKFAYPIALKLCIGIACVSFCKHCGQAGADQKGDTFDIELEIFTISVFQGFYFGVILWIKYALTATLY